MRGKVILVLSGDALSKVLLLLVNILLIRVLTVPDYAKFTLIFSVLMLGYQLVCAAIERLYIADFEAFSPHATRLLAVSVMFFGGVLMLYLYSSTTGADLLLFLLGLTILSAYQFERIKFQQQQRFRQFSGVELIKNGGWFFLVLGWGAYSGGATPLSALGSLFVAAGVGLIYMRLVAGRSLPSSKKSGPENSLLTMLRKSSDVFLYTLLAALMPYLPVFMVNLSGQNDTLATYGAAMRYQGIMGMLVYALNSVYLPTISQASSCDEARSFAFRFYRTLPIAGLTVCMAIIGFSICIPYIDGGRYPMTPYVFVVLAACGFLSLTSIPAVNQLLAQRHYRQILIAISSGIAVNWIAFVVLKGVFPMLGAALASLAGYAVANSIIVYFGFRCFSRRPG